MEATTKGAWIIHHGKKIQGSLHAASDYSAIDVAAKSAGLLARMSADEQSTLPSSKVEVLARVGGLNPRSELSSILEHLKKQRVIDVSRNGDVEVLGITTNKALLYASNIFDDLKPANTEIAVIELGEISSKSPVGLKDAVEYISDVEKIRKKAASELISDACSVGFVDIEGDEGNQVLFNGNLFRRDTVAKTSRILNSLSNEEIGKFKEFEEILKKEGAIESKRAAKILGDDLLGKLRAAAVFDENIISNESGDFSFITSPGAFNKYSNPFEDDAFDHAKMLVSALSYGMNNSTRTRGKIWGVDLLLRKLIRGDSVGPAPAIGND